MRVFLDANVLFSAANAKGHVARLIDLVIDEHEAITSDFAVEEAKRNVLLKRPQWSDRLAKLIANMDVGLSTLFPLSVPLDEKDRPILCTAIRSQCELLATGDKKHFGHLFELTVEGVTIVSLLGLAQRVGKMGQNDC